MNFKRVHIGFRSIRSKIAFSILVSVLLLSFALIAYNSYSTRKNAINNAQDQMHAIALFYAEKTKGELEKALDAARHLSQTLSAVKDPVYPPNLTRDQVNAMIRSLLQNNSTFFGVGAFWEPNAFDRKDKELANTSGHDESGAFIPYWYKDGRGNIVMDAYSEAYNSDFYKIPKKSQREVVLEPYLFWINQRQVLITTFVAPILYDFYFYGVTAFDITLEPVIKMIATTNLYEGYGKLQLISNDGTFVASSGYQINMSGKKLLEVYPDFEERLKYIRDGKPYTIYNNEQIEVSVPLFLGNTDAPWQVSVSVPQWYITQKATGEMWRQIFISLIVVTLILTVVIWLVNNLLEPLEEIADFAGEVSTGDLYVEKKVTSTGTEILRLHTVFMVLMQGLQRIAQFAKEIGRGNLDAEFTPLSHKDVLGNALLDMRESLKEALTKEEMRKEEDRKRNWSAEGLGRFNNILRQSEEGVEQVAYQIISSLVDYLDANQGGLFIINEEDKSDVYLELSAAYAYNRRRLKKMTFKLGEGLIGTCAIERITFYINEIPADYIKITSGLGDAPPRTLLLVPLILNDEIFGVIEIASFNELKQYEIEFVERLADSIAVTLGNTKVAARTSALMEQTKKQATELKFKEREMQQNIEALHESQYELERNEAQMNSILKALDSAALVAEFDMDSQLNAINNKYIEVLGLDKKQLIGKRQTEMMIGESAYSIRFQKLWQTLKMGQAVQQVRNFNNVKGQAVWLSEFYYPITDSTGTPIKVLNIAFDITENKQKEEEIQDLLKESQEKTQLLIQQEKAMQQNMEEMLQMQEDMEEELEEVQFQAQKVQKELNEKIALLEKQLSEK